MRVKEIRGCRYTSPLEYNVHVEQEVYQALIHASQSLPLVPSIKRLVWDNTSVESFKYLKSLFISPTLTILHLWLTGEDGCYDFSLFSLLTSLSLLCPSVSTLGLTADPRDMLDDRRKSEISMHTSATLSAFRNLMHLQRLELALIRMPETALCNLITLDCLRSLRICNIPPHGFQHPMPEDRRNPFFPRLEHLEMTKCTIEFSLWMFANMWETPLKTLILEFVEPPTAANWKTLFRTIHDQIPHRHLRVIDISFEPVRHGTTDIGLTMRELSPLLSFTRLTRVSLGLCISLDDDVMTRIALAWPHLESFYLRDQPIESSQSVTFEGLANLARNCQALEGLCLPSIDVTRMLPDLLDLDGVPCNRTLVVLNVQNSSIDDPSLVAALLSALFPNLQAIYAGEFMVKWTRVMLSIQRNRDIPDCPEADCNCKPSACDIA